MGFSKGQAEVFDGVGGGEGAGRVHDQEDLFPLFGDEVEDGGSDGGDVIGVGFCGGAVGAGADEGEDEGWVAVFCLEGGEDGGEDGGTFPDPGDEDEGWFGHYG